MTAILVHYLLFVSFSFLIIEKLKLQDMAGKSKIWLIYKLAKCDFCFNFWIAVLTTLVVDAVSCRMDIIDLILPFEIMGIWLILNSVKNEE